MFKDDCAHILHHLLSIEFDPLIFLQIYLTLHFYFFQIFETLLIDQVDFFLGLCGDRLIFASTYQCLYLTLKKPFFVKIFCELIWFSANTALLLPDFLRIWFMNQHLFMGLFDGINRRGLEWKTFCPSFGNVVIEEGHWFLSHNFNIVNKIVFLVFDFARNDGVIELTGHVIWNEIYPVSIRFFEGGRAWNDGTKEYKQKQNLLLILLDLCALCFIIPFVD